MSHYVCAFRGRRDSYQVPLALAESGQLDQFITDAYALPWVRFAANFAPASVRSKADFRSEPGIPSGDIQCLWGTTALEHARHKLGFGRTTTHRKLDRHFSLAALRRAMRSRSDLLLYSSYAWEAFTARYAHEPRKVLFQYHPHPDLEKRILMADAMRHPEARESYSNTSREQPPEALGQRERDCWKHADLIFCASTFTKQSLVEAGADEKQCRVIPYGIAVPDEPAACPPAEAFHAAFVGSGTQRKGLHHLLLAWKRCRLPPSSKLTLVCRIIDHSIKQLALTIPGVELREGVIGDELEKIFASSTLFAMPSLVEGFGQVYLEALAQGCPVLGTANTCLPDIGSEEDGVYRVSPGNIDELTDKLETLSIQLPGNLGVRKASRAGALRRPWQRFRLALCDQLRDC